MIQDYLRPCQTSPMEYFVKIFNSKSQNKKKKVFCLLSGYRISVLRELSINQERTWFCSSLKVCLEAQEKGSCERPGWCSTKDTWWNAMLNFPEKNIFCDG